MGKLTDGILGPDLEDQAGETHTGITTMPIAVLQGDQARIREIRNKAASIEDLLLVDFCNAAQTSKSYDEYAEKLSKTPVSDLDYLGIALFGAAKKVTKLTGNLGLMP
jgi:hypothetical protein